MRSRFLAISALVLALAVAAVGCSSDDTGEEGTATTEATTTTTEPRTTTTELATTTTEAMEPIEIVIWVDEKRASIIQTLAPKVLEETGVVLKIEQFDLAALPGLVRDAPDGEGPDIFIGAHFWTGELAAAGIVAPVDLGGRDDEWVDVSRAAFNYGGSLFAVPYATEAIALYYNDDLVPQPPATFEEMTAICDALDDVDNCLGIPGGSDDVSSAAYHNYPFVSVFGGYIFGFDSRTGFDATDVGLDSSEAIAGAMALEELIAGGYVGNVTEEEGKAQFIAGSSPFFLDGPWFLDDLEKTQMSYGVATLPTAAGSNPGPLVGAQGFFINDLGDNPGAAQAFLLEYVANESVMTALSSADQSSPAYLASVEVVATEDDIAEAFARSAAAGQPIPSVPEMNDVWEPLSVQMNGIRNGTTGAETAMQTAASQVRQAAGG